jgi:hypothetical protein
MSQARIEANHLHLFGGSYNFRLMRGSNQLSMHSWGCALDLDPEGNPFGRNRAKCRMPAPVVEAFQAEGFEWGGRWKRPDAMHFQAARTR